MSQTSFFFQSIFHEKPIRTSPAVKIREGLSERIPETVMAAGKSASLILPTFRRCRFKYRLITGLIRKEKRKLSRQSRGQRKNKSRSHFVRELSGVFFTPYTAQFPYL